MISNDTFNFINTDRYSGALQQGITFLTSCYVFESCSDLPNDLTGYLPKFGIQETFGSPGYIAECTIANGRAELLPDRGIINFQISATDTAELPVGMWVYEITITSSDGIVYRLAFGQFEITP